jgi:hypothetical protein
MIRVPSGLAFCAGISSVQQAQPGPASCAARAFSARQRAPQTRAIRDSL